MFTFLAASREDSQGFCLGIGLSSENIKHIREGNPAVVRFGELNPLIDKSPEGPATRFELDNYIGLVVYEDTMEQCEKTAQRFADEWPELQEKMVCVFGLDKASVAELGGKGGGGFFLKARVGPLVQNVFLFKSAEMNQLPVEEIAELYVELGNVFKAKTLNPESN